MCLKDQSYIFTCAEAELREVKYLLSHNLCEKFLVFICARSSPGLAKCNDVTMLSYQTTQRPLNDFNLELLKDTVNISILEN